MYMYMKAVSVATEPEDIEEIENGHNDVHIRGSQQSAQVLGGGEKK